MNCLWAEVARYNENSRVREAWQTLKAAVEIDNSAQQLKAKIAACADRLSAIPTWEKYQCEIDVLVSDLRQLSAV
jgi:hypothetical protein